MKKIVLTISFLAVATAANAGDWNCGKGNTKQEKILCRWEKYTAPEYIAGCLDATAPEVGAIKAADICLAEYEQHKENKERAKAERAKAKGGNDGSK